MVVTAAGAPPWAEAVAGTMDRATAVAVTRASEARRSFKTGTPSGKTGWGIGAGDAPGKHVIDHSVVTAIV